MKAASSASTALIPSSNIIVALGFSGALGNIDAYISAANRQPMLTHEEEISLARRLRDDNDLAAAQKLMLSHLRLVVSIARGYFGLWPAACRSDSGRQYRPDESGQAFRSGSGRSSCFVLDALDQG
jgi:hypothetical protein